jgi:TrmH family RNA methyltransferase
LLIQVSSAQNKYIRIYRSLGKRKIRRQTSLLPLEGTRLVHEAVRFGMRFEAVLLREGGGPADFPFLENLWGRVPVCLVDDKLFEQSAFTETPQGIMAVIRRPLFTLQDVFAATTPLVMVTDGLQDPGNLGTMLRSVAAAGAGGAVLLPGTTDVTNPKVLRSSMGAFFHLPVVEAPLAGFLTEIRKHGLRLVAAAADAGLEYDQYDWCQPSAVVFGNEGAGVSAEVLAEADATVAVPLSGDVESLNAAVAMSVIFFEASRQRRIAR